MTDYTTALAAAREALDNHDYGHEIPAYVVRDLLAALDAARGEAVAYRFWDSEEDRWQWGEAACAEKDDELLYAAPPAAVFKSTAKRVAALQARDAEQTPPAADEALADTQRAIIEAAERRGYERGLKEAPPAAAVPAGKDWQAEAMKHAQSALYWRERCEMLEDPVRKAQQPAAAVPAEWRVVWFTGSFKRGSERWEIYDPEGNGGAVDKGDIRDDMVWGLLDALAAANKESSND